MTCPDPHVPLSDLVARAVALWRQGKLDTADIAQMLGLTEARVYNAIGTDRERRRAGR